MVMGMPSTQPRTSSPTPLSIISVRVLVAVQIVAGYLASILFALCALFAWMFSGFEGRQDHNKEAALALLALTVLLVFLVIALGRSVAALRRGCRSDHITLATVEGGLVTTLLALLALTGSSWASSMGGLAALPIGALITGAAVLALLAQPGARAWTSER